MLYCSCICERVVLHVLQLPRWAWLVSLQIKTKKYCTRNNCLFFLLNAAFVVILLAFNLKQKENNKI